jgi:hypothetical protein
MTGNGCQLPLSTNGWGILPLTADSLGSVPFNTNGMFFAENKIIVLEFSASWEFLKLFPNVRCMSLSRPEVLR